MDEKKKPNANDKSRRDVGPEMHSDKRSGRTSAASNSGRKATSGNWADEAAKARTADDPRARTPSDSAGQPSIRSFEE